jgi:hypothetical protein
MDNYQLYIYFGIIGLLSFVGIILMTLLIISKNKRKELEKRLSNREEIANESYVKFLNNSRDSAYAYIEDVQEKLVAFANRVEPQLNYYNTYGTAVQGPHSILAKEISEAYEDLKTIMPQDNKENNK